MFDNGHNFFDNKNHRTEYDRKLKKLKTHLKPKDILYKLELAPQTIQNSDSCALELKPTKLSDTSLEYRCKKQNEEPKVSKKRHKLHKISISKHDTKPNQKCVDDSILTGLQTVIDLCGLLERCDKENKLTKIEQTDRESLQNENKIRDDDLHQSSVLPLNSHDNISLNESRDALKMHKRSSESSNFRKLLIKNSLSRLKNICSAKSSSIYPTEEQNITPKQPSNQSSYSQTFQILNSSKQEPAQSLNFNEEYHVLSACCAKKSSTSNNMKPIEEEPRACSKATSNTGMPCEHCPVARQKSQQLSDKEQSQKADTREPSKKRSKKKVSKKRSKRDVPKKRSKSKVSKKRSKRDVPKKRSKSKVSKDKRKSPKRSSSLESITDEKSSKTDSTTGLVDDSTCGTPSTSAPSSIDGEHYETGTKRPVCLSAKCFPPLEIIADVHADSEICIDDHQPCSRKPLTQTATIYVPATSDQSVARVIPKCCREIIAPVPQKPVRRHTAIYTPEALCNKDRCEPIIKTQMDFNTKRNGIPVVQPVVGFCSDGKCGAAKERLKSIKYALVKISEFMGFSTYEIMKPYKEKPKHIPTCIAEIFVTSCEPRKNDNIVISRSLSVHRRLPFSASSLEEQEKARSKIRIAEVMREPHNEYPHFEGHGSYERRNVSFTQTETTIPTCTCGRSKVIHHQREPQVHECINKTSLRQTSVHGHGTSKTHFGQCTASDTHPRRECVQSEHLNQVCSGQRVTERTELHDNQDVRNAKSSSSLRQMPATKESTPQQPCTPLRYRDESCRQPSFITSIPCQECYDRARLRGEPYTKCVCSSPYIDSNKDAVQSKEPSVTQSHEQTVHEDKKQDKKNKKAKKKSSKKKLNKNKSTDSIPSD